MKKFLILYFFIFIANSVFAIVTIDSVRTVISTCPNNGSIFIFASASNPPLLYSITAGPETRPQQSGSVFNGLLPGTYTVVATNFINESDTAIAVILSNYTEPDFSPLVHQQFCLGTQIIGHPNSSGKKPLHWDLTNNSTGQTVSQPSDTFGVSEIGSYTMRMYDSCQNFVTRIVDVNFIDTGVNASLGATVSKTGCDTVMLKIFGSIPPSAGIQQLTLKVYHGNDTIVRIINSPFFPITVIIPGMSYGSDLRYSLESICGRTLFGDQNRVPPFQFQIYLQPRPIGCNNEVYYGNLFSAEDNLYTYYPTDFKPPVQFTIRDIDSNKIVQVGGVLDEVTPKTGGRNYEITITDGCGQAYIFDTIWPFPISPAVNVTTRKGYGCIDSTAYVAFSFNGLSDQFTLEILSGTKLLHSTKPGFSYFDSIQYPQVYDFQNPVFEFMLKNLPKGTYQYKVTDTCGHVITGSFEITNNDIVSMVKDNMRYVAKTGCLNANTLFFEPLTPYISQAQVIDLNTNRTLYYVFINGIETYVSPIAAGTYLILLSNNLQAQRINVNVDSCISFYDTVVIKPYERPKTSNVTTFTCNGSFNALLMPDSTKGVSPYQFEIIDGPVLFPLQSSNIFSGLSPGVYRARIIDTCGNSNVVDFSVDTLLYPVLNQLGSSCINGSVSLFLESSPYFSYRWLKPDGSVFIGDTLRISNVVASDTGIYTITRFVTVNSCTDSSKIEFDLISNNVYNYSMEICEGDSIMFRSHAYTQTGVYTDTVFSAACDTIYNLNLSVLPPAHTVIDTSICTGQVIQVGNHSYTQPGTYSDTIRTSGCDSIVTLHLLVTGSTVFNSSRQICEGDSASFRTHIYTQTGVYSDTAYSSGCDTIYNLSLLVVPIPQTNIDTSMCDGNVFQIGNHTYDQPGTYYDTIATNLCDSILIYHLSFAPPLNIQITASQTLVYSGDTVRLGFLPELPGSVIAWTPVTLLSDSSAANPLATIINPTWIYVAVRTPSLCAGNDSVFIDIKQRPDTLSSCRRENIFIPNAFSPNGDGVNDMFFIRSGVLRSMSLLIYDRWSNKIFESDDIRKGWDGMRNGEPLPVDVYGYFFEGECMNGEKISIKGNITLLR
jgi:gliding motility-associated-like protein